MNSHVGSFNKGIKLLKGSSHFTGIKIYGPFFNISEHPNYRWSGPSHEPVSTYVCQSRIQIHCFPVLLYVAGVSVSYLDELGGLTLRNRPSTTVKRRMTLVLGMLSFLFGVDILIGVFARDMLAYMYVCENV